MTCDVVDVRTSENQRDSSSEVGCGTAAAAVAHPNFVCVPDDGGALLAALRELRANSDVTMRGHCDAWYPLFRLDDAEPRLWISSGKLSGKFRLVARPILVGQSHRAAWQACRRNDGFELWTGFACGASGVWFPHSWCATRRAFRVQDPESGGDMVCDPGTLVETAVLAPLDYFGHAVDPDEFFARMSEDRLCLDAERGGHACPHQRALLSTDSRGPVSRSAAKGCGLTLAATAEDDLLYFDAQAE